MTRPRAAQTDRLALASIEASLTPATQPDCIPITPTSFPIHRGGNSFVTTVLQARSRGFVSTPYIERLTRRAFRYLQSGFSVHLRGPAGTGKTTIALHLADLLGRPIMLIFGDDESTTSDLIGNRNGYSRKKVVDNFIHSVVKVEDEMRQNWVDSRLTMACREGFTLVYDEFNRSRPEVNNVLLSALEEKLLVLPPSAQHNEYLRVSPHFRGIFTSNPEEYCGVHATQDALMDRLITIDVPEPDDLTQQEIIVQKTSLPRQSAYVVVQLVKLFRQGAKVGKSSGLRAALVIAKVCQEHGIPISARNDEFRDTCGDILLSRAKLDLEEGTQLLWHCLGRLETLERQSGIAVAQEHSLSVEEAVAAGAIAPLDQPSPATVPAASPVSSPLNASVNGASSPTEAIARNGHGNHNGHSAPGSAPLVPAASEFGLEAPVPQNGAQNSAQNGIQDQAASPAESVPEPIVAVAAPPDPTEPATTHLPPSPQLPSFTQNGAQAPIAPVPLGGQGTEAIGSDRAFGNDVEQSIYAYLQASQGQHLSAIEAALGISRVQAVDALRSLAEQGWVVVQRDDSASHDAGRTIYRVEATPA